MHDKYKYKVRKKYKDRCDLGQWGSMGDGVEVPVRVAPFLKLIITVCLLAKHIQIQIQIQIQIRHGC